MSAPVPLSDHAPGVPLDDPQGFLALRPLPALYVGGLPAFQRLTSGSEFTTQLLPTTDTPHQPIRLPPPIPIGGEGGLLPLEKDRGGSAGAMITLGRFENNDLVVPDDRVSKFHGYFQESNQGWTFTDAGSTNGSHLDGLPLVPLRSYPLNPGSTLVLSSEVILVFLPPLQICRLLRGDAGPGSPAAPPPS